MSEAYRADQVRIVNLKDTPVAALEYRGNRKFIGKAAREFAAWRRRNNLPPKLSATFNIIHADSGGDCHYDLCAATQREVGNDGSDVVAKTIPGGRCAVIRHIGTDDALHDIAAYLHGGWLPKSGEKRRDFPLFLQRVRFPPEVPENEAVTDVFLPLE